MVPATGRRAADVTAFNVDDDVLFDIELPPPVSLADKFGVPPISVLDRRAGDWQDRRRRWLALGIQSELGRDSPVYQMTRGGATDWLAEMVRGTSYAAADGTSVFDPVVCELVYRWFSRPLDRVLDPFAGGSVRGVTASVLARYYTGIDLRPEQIDANEAQVDLCDGPRPWWVVGDAAHIDALVGDTMFDLVFSCPPYGDLERYSDDPRDLSTMTPDGFRDAHRFVIETATGRLRDDRFACWVMSDVRDRKGAYRGLVADTIRAFTDAGLTLHNDAVILNPIGTAAVRAERPFLATRKLTRAHQHLLVFVKGDAKRATARMGGNE